jgi:hypothetical protein
MVERDDDPLSIKLGFNFVGTEEKKEINQCASVCTSKFNNV